MGQSMKNMGFTKYSFSHTSMNQWKMVEGDPFERCNQSIQVPIFASMILGGLGFTSLVSVCFFGVRGDMMVLGWFLLPMKGFGLGSMSWGISAHPYATHTPHTRLNEGIKNRHKFGLSRCGTKYSWLVHLPPLNVPSPQK